MNEWVSREKSTAATDLEIRGKTIPKSIVQILYNRGCDSRKRIEKYFAPSLSDLYDPFLMNNMEKAVDRLMRAIRDKEKILVHGDYDTDGITGVALIINNLKKLGLDVVWYIPHRLTEGYGLSRIGIEHAIKNKCTLIITVDCGINAVKEILYAQKNGIDTIVCDHHKSKKKLPDAFAVLDPKIPGSNYPFKELAGVGVAFKLFAGLYEKMNLSREEIYADLDLVALGTVVDVVPLIDENRILVKYGIKKILKSKKTGFEALLTETSLKRGLASYHLGFIIGPRINACGRLRDAKEALELFLTQDTATAEKVVKNISEDNKKRQQIEDGMYFEAIDLIEKEDKDKNRVIVIGKEDWHEGVLGIVASRITDQKYKPTILLALKENVAKGSARSIPGFDIIEGLNQCSELFLKYGGHRQAAGLEMEREKYQNLEACLNEYANELNNAIFNRNIIYDIPLDLDGITDTVVYFLKFFEPTGMGNPLPVFLGKNFEIVGIPRVVGNDHLKFALRSRGKVFDAIAYGHASQILDIEVGKTRVDCLYSISEDSFFGKKKIVLKIKEMRRIT
jgi:single-stranded-DNA-specific exonuclease